MSKTEVIVGGIWAELLQAEDVQSSSNFFALGGDSMMLMIAQYRIAEILKVELPPDAISDAPTLREYCKVIDSLCDAP
jgi:acyl carrier protein